jgi:hypothetical protein
MLAFNGTGDYLFTNALNKGAVERMIIQNQTCVIIT